LSKVVVKSDFKSQSYGPDTIMLKGHAVTLTFKSDPNIVRDTLSQNDDHLCKKMVKSDFK